MQCARALVLHENVQGVFFTFSFLRFFYVFVSRFFYVFVSRFFYVFVFATRSTSRTFFLRFRSRSVFLRCQVRTVNTIRSPEVSTGKSSRKEYSGLNRPARIKRQELSFVLTFSFIDVGRFANVFFTFSSTFFLRFRGVDGGLENVKKTSQNLPRRKRKKRPERFRVKLSRRTRS